MRMYIYSHVKELFTGCRAQQRAAVRDFTGAPLTAAQHISGHLAPFPQSLAKLDALRRNLAADAAPPDTAAAPAAVHESSAGAGDSRAGGSASNNGGGGGKQQRSELFLMAHTRHADGRRDRDVYSHW